MQLMSYRTEGGIRIQREIGTQPYRPADTALAGALDTRRGVLFSSSFEFPGRYTRWDMGFVDPPMVFTARGRQFAVEALNERGRILLDPIAETAGALAATTVERTSADRLAGEIRHSKERFPEERRSRQPSVFSVLRALIGLFTSVQDQHLGFYGAFGYDLVFQFEPMRLRRSSGKRSSLWRISPARRSADVLSTVVAASAPSVSAIGSNKMRPRSLSASTANCRPRAVNTIGGSTKPMSQRV